MPLKSEKELESLHALKNSDIAQINPTITFDVDTALLDSEHKLKTIPERKQFPIISGLLNKESRTSISKMDMES